MNWKPILFNSEMVCAILDGRKTVTRRVVKPQPVGDMHHVADGTTHGYWIAGNCQPFRPIYRPGDILYVRETWGYRITDTPSNLAAQRLFKADFPNSMGLNVKWHPSIHMPKEAARLFLRVKKVRAERLQDITEEQARAEGAKPFALSFDPEDTPEEERTWHEVETARDDFIDLWGRTIKKAELPRYGWDANPWVWVIEFERISKEEAMKGENNELV